MKDEISEHELLRKKLWCDVFSNTASANDCKSPYTACNFANKALEFFDQKFPAPVKLTEA